MMKKNTAIRYTLTLTQEQYQALATMLENVPETDDSDASISEIRDQLVDVLHIPAAKYMYYINVYNIDQAYGGPEEGGWYYHTHDCHTSIGIFCDPCDGESQFTRDHRFDELITTALQYLQSFEPKWQDDGAAQEIFNDLNEYGCFVAYDTDKYGCGELVEISRTPGNRHDTRRQYYE